MKPEKNRNGFEFHRSTRQFRRSTDTRTRVVRTVGRSKPSSIPSTCDSADIFSRKPRARVPLSALRRARRLRRTRPLPRSRCRSRRRTRARKAPRRASRAPPSPEKCNGRRLGRADATPPPRGGRRRPRRAPQTDPRRCQVQRRARSIRPERGRRSAGLGRLEAVPVRLYAHLRGDIPESTRREKALPPTRKSDSRPVGSPRFRGVKTVTTNAVFD